MADPVDTLYPPPLVLIGGLPEPTLARVLQAEGFGVIQVPTGTRVVEWAHDVLPDLILLREDLRDMPALDACESLRRNPRIGHNVPILILTSDRPSPGQRVAALSAGAWDFLPYPGDAKELAVKLQSNLQAKRNLDMALAEGLVDPMTGLHNRIGLARRARELGALMSRRHGALGCVVFELDTGVPNLEAGGLVARRSTRVSDVVGVLSPKEVAVVAPGTDDAGVVQLALRVGRALSAGVGGDVFVPGSTLRAGYDAVSNATYAPVDPVELLARASTAVRSGRPESGSSWVCRFESAAGSAQRDARTSSSTQAVRAAGRIGTGA